MASTDLVSNVSPEEISPEESVQQRLTHSSSIIVDAGLLAVIPNEVIERNDGDSAPLPFVRPGDTVLDLGSGDGKNCFRLAQVVGPTGRVIGIDCNADRLEVARRKQREVAERLGYDNVHFRRGLIQDLRLDLDALDDELAERPVQNAADWLVLRQIEDRLRTERPLVADGSVDCVVASCILNLVRLSERVQLFQEMFRVVKRGGRAVIREITSDEDVSSHLRNDPQLWSGRIAGACREDEFLQALEAAGFHGMQIVQRDAEPWRTIEGIEFRTVTAVAFKGKQGLCLERHQAVIYRGPFRKVEDDDGHAYFRGERMAVCDKTFHLLQREPYAGLFEPIEPRDAIPLDDAAAFDCRRSARRHPRETKGGDYQLTTPDPNACCEPGGSCCS